MATAAAKVSNCLSGVGVSVGPAQTVAGTAAPGATITVRPGQTFEITESGPDDYDLDLTCAIGETSQDGPTIMIPPGSTATCTATNAFTTPTPTPTGSPTSTPTPPPSLSPTPPPYPSPSSKPPLPVTSGPGLAAPVAGTMLLVAGTILFVAARRRYGPRHRTNRQ